MPRLAVAHLICQKLDRSLEAHWCANAACARKCLREKRCDVILGHPLDEGAPKDIAWSVPYAGAQFGLVVPGDARGIRSLADLIGKRVGVVCNPASVDHDLRHIHRLAVLVAHGDLRFGVGAEQRLLAGFARFGH